MFHVSTLLQVAELLSHHGEATKAAETIERALFAYNTAFHSLFNISSGRVRLPFKYYENRGFYLSIYRHVRILERKGTWGTAFEFLKLLLEVSAEEDPYCVLLMIDIYAIHAGAEQFLIDLGTSHLFENRIKDYPNIWFSLALAYFHSSDHQAAQNALAKAGNNFPWTLSALAFALGLDVPPQLMKFNGPPSTFQEIMTQLYISRALPLWSSSATKKLLEQTIDGIKTQPPVPPAYILDSQKDISRDLTRHVLLVDIKPVLEILPRNLISGEEIWSDDMLPPLDSISPYASNPFQALRTTGSASAIPGEDGGQIGDADHQGTLDGLWNSLLQWRRRRRDGGEANDDDDAEFDPEEEEIAWALANEAVERARTERAAEEQRAPTVRELTGEELVQAENEEEAEIRQERGQSYLGSLFQRFAGILRTDGSPNEDHSRESDYGEEAFADAMEDYSDTTDTESIGA